MSGKNGVSGVGDWVSQTPVGRLTSNNQRLRSAGDNDQRSKRFCSIAVLCVSFMWHGQNTRHQITRGRRAKRALSNCVVYIKFILSGSPNECWLYTCDACVITTWRLGLRPPLVARNNFGDTTVSMIEITYETLLLLHIQSNLPKVSTKI